MVYCNILQVNISKLFVTKLSFFVVITGNTFALPKAY